MKKVFYSLIFLSIVISSKIYSMLAICNSDKDCKKAEVERVYGQKNLHCETNPVKIFGQTTGKTIKRTGKKGLCVPKK